jgi:hypothetical protein
MAPDPSDELPRVTPSMLRRAAEMCPRRLKHEHESGRKLSPLGDGAFEVGNRLTNDALTWHAGKVDAAHGFPEPQDLEVEQRAVYRAAADAYIRTFGATTVEVHDLGWSTDVEDAGVRLVGNPGIAVVDEHGDHEVRVLRVGTRGALIDTVDIRFLLLRTRAWARDRVRVVAVDLLEDRSVEYDIDVAERVGEAHAWLAGQVEIIRSRVDARRTRLGADCRMCPCIPGCPALTRGS